MISSIYHRLRPITYILYGALAGLAYTAAYLLRFEFDIPPNQVDTLLLTVPVVVAVRLILARAFKLSTGRWRFVSTAEVVRLFTAMTLGSALLLLLRELIAPGLVIPRSVLLIEWVLSSYITAGLWLSYRVGFERLRKAKEAASGEDLKRALIVGAGEAGRPPEVETYMFRRERTAMSVRR